MSEARSLLAATQRQEKSMRERLESDIRELQLKLHKLEVKRIMTYCYRIKVLPVRDGVIFIEPYANMREAFTLSMSVW